MRAPPSSKTYRPCTIDEVKKGKKVRCVEPALVPWEKRNDPKYKAKCKKHGGPR